ncbi:hypothetical protein ASPZODRAFT_130955 [Penicilliopsis zonata CBS 506.65]|uniref:Uncharacterized protein n=1 Tax=Penicilliopsis zonata CBS 506.65 TaxID=1073090 RepID=A0A1L9SJQ6_9EURO|nr:hypothetical protein ASPZODRAFT_130955 [Penicilliopsis zonata CBS 506.65]OJJ47472.1 hypothetical protein ASPZODRAFT_130955 [Penicilliopsis zonata CBS 506.65]
MLFATPTGPYTNPSPRFKRLGRRSLPLLVGVGIVFGLSSYYKYQTQHRLSQVQEEERLRRNQQLMDAYGHKESLQDVEHALDMYDN